MLTPLMNAYKKNIEVQRGGSDLRQNSDRYFYLKPLGWFLRTRGDVVISEGLEVSGGIVGPFRSRAAAKFHLLKMIYEENPELFSRQQQEKIAS